MGLVYADVRLGNDARPELEEINALALVDTGALHLCIPEHVAPLTTTVAKTTARSANRRRQISHGSLCQSR